MGIQLRPAPPTPDFLRFVFFIVRPPFKNKKRRYNKTAPSKNAVVWSMYLREKYVQYSALYYGITNGCSCQCPWENFVEGWRKLW
ncbi:hypothetical protein D1159_17240 [Pseudoflavonifractor sp. 524-17]|nr:hypothetical protein [Pseudoflavonifractor sp. 524-17]